ncbi:Uncharacterised protein [Mycobacteroides abscessus subsp. massiliense]|nr:Uncharacterised protein [Mycobacteroides abscessus subsp. massiliense]
MTCTMLAMPAAVFLRSGAASTAFWVEVATSPITPSYTCAVSSSRSVKFS